MSDNADRPEWRPPWPQTWGQVYIALAAWLAGVLGLAFLLDGHGIIP